MIVYECEDCDLRSADAGLVMLHETENGHEMERAETDQKQEDT